MSEQRSPPAGFRAMPLRGGFFAAFGPLYSHIDGDVGRLGFFVAEQHISPRDVCHGGAISAFADMQALVAQQLAGVRDRFTPTISLSVDYIAPAHRGDWLEMQVRLLRATRNLLFTEGPVVSTAGTLIARTSGVFKIPHSPHSDPAAVAAQLV